MLKTAPARTITRTLTIWIAASFFIGSSTAQPFGRPQQPTKIFVCVTPTTGDIYMIAPVGQRNVDSSLPRKCNAGDERFQLNMRGGLSCWDINGDGIATTNEDINGDGVPEVATGHPTLLQKATGLYGRIYIPMTGNDYYF